MSAEEQQLLAVYFGHCLMHALSCVSTKLGKPNFAFGRPSSSANYTDSLLIIFGPLLVLHKGLAMLWLFCCLNSLPPPPTPITAWGYLSIHDYTTWGMRTPFILQIGTSRGTAYYWATNANTTEPTQDNTPIQLHCSSRAGTPRESPQSRYGLGGRSFSDIDMVVS